MCPEVLENMPPDCRTGKAALSLDAARLADAKNGGTGRGTAGGTARLCEKNGQLAWHALPFTSHFDFCGLEDFIQGMQEARRLSQHHGKPLPIAAKMTDVPGHGAHAARPASRGRRAVSAPRLQ